MTTASNGASADGVGTRGGGVSSVTCQPASLRRSAVT